MVGVVLPLTAHENSHVAGESDEIDGVLAIAAIPKLDHLVDIFAYGTLTWTDMPGALTELDNDSTYRRRINLTNYREVRIVTKQTVSGAAAAKIRGQYSTDDSTYAYFGAGDTPSVSITATGWVVSAWASLVAAAKADVYVRVVGISGSGTHDPAWTWIALEFR